MPSEGRCIRNVPSPFPGLALGNTKGNVLVVTLCLSHASALRDGTETRVAQHHIVETKARTNYLTVLQDSAFC